MLGSRGAAKNNFPRSEWGKNEGGNEDEKSVTGIQGATLVRYYWERVDKSPGMRIDLRQGRRFQVMSGGKYLLITPGMVSGGPYKLIGVGIDCSNPKGCCLIVK